MTLDAVKQRFEQEVKARGYRDQYIDENEEREIIQIAIQQGCTTDSAVATLAMVCERLSYVLESKVLDQVKDLLDTFASNDGKVDEKEFNDAVSVCKKATKGKKNDVQCKKMVVKIIEDQNYKVKTGLFSNWYKNVKRDIGMA
jgi:hypothetical protein